MNKRLRVSAVLALAALGGCASYPDVVPVGRDTYLITRQQATGFPGLGKLETDIITDGSKYCQKQKRQFRLLSVRTTNPPYVPGNYPRAEIRFECLAAGDPRLNETVLQKGLDTVKR